MDEIKHVYQPYGDCWHNRNDGWGAGGIAAAAVAFLAVGGLALWAGNRRSDDWKYMSAKSQGLQEAGIGCNSAGIADIKCQLNQMQLLENIKCAVANGTSNVINAGNVNQQKTDTGLAVIANQIGQTNAVLNRTLGNCFVYSKPICDTTTPTTTA